MMRGHVSCFCLVSCLFSGFVLVWLRYLIWLVYGMVWFGLVWWYGMVWYGMVWYGMVWFGLVWYGLVWFGVACFGSVDIIG